jgi:hypothetical protein
MLSNYLDFSDREGLAGVPARVDFTAGQRPETTSNNNPTIKTEPMASPTAPISSTQPLSETCWSRGSRSQSAEPRNVRGSQRHNETEKNYRAKINNEFSKLLHALPEKMVSGAPNERGIKVEKTLSKAGTLALARIHIKNLEAEEKELQEESLVLRGEVALYKRLLTMRGGGNID